MNRRYRTIVIGAGPAGLNSARRLADDCIVLDGKESIGRPVRCGEGVSLEVLAREGIEPDDQWIARYIHQIRRIMPNGRAIGRRRIQAHACVLDRTRFESFLASGVVHEIRLNERVRAIERTNSSWRVRTNRGNEYRSTYLIGADGPCSRVAKIVFNHTHRLAAGWNHHLRFKQPILHADTLDMYFGRAVSPGGYGWFFPTSRHTANVGLLIKKNPASVQAFRTFVRQIIRPLHGDFVVIGNKSGTLPAGGRAETVMRHNAFLVGDAGGFTDPIFCGGIGMSMLTGRLAAESINRDRPEYYEEAIRLLPFTNEDLIAARDAFFSLDDETLNQLGDLLDEKGMDYLASPEGRTVFAGYDRLKENRDAISCFAKTWGAARQFLW